MVIQKLDYPNFQTLIYIIEKKQTNGAITSSELKEIKELATENGISKDEVEELMDLLEVTY
ncbi:MAG: hypothetical protein CMB80_31345 [Flammeovirgaceae bacterium]|nr:hypothetical protein [Flammeovirgaceae bacterium]MBE61969.1 hypothetical protein [Flammeovirgaceae bacterium]HCX23566.1 hypothetical protein [Cytophagales bacterium]|tara:strand:+ start:287 stop:469 length:183 start_codon:yes stop_codon:yes gene_type:complete